MNRDKIELNDAHKTLGIRQIKNKQVSTEEINIFLGGIHQESLTVAKAVHLCKGDFKRKINVILANIENKGFYIFDGTSFKTCNEPRNYEYSFFNNQVNAKMNGDMPKYEYYSENKHLTGIILKMAGINYPKEIIFKKRQNSSGTNRYLLNSINEILGTDDKIVLKPATGFGGKGIKIIDGTQIGPNFYDENIKDSDTIILQERIPSFPINIDGKKKDWNLRVLVTYDILKKRYKTTGIIGRIDDEGGPINVSITADYISLEQIAKLAGWTNKEYKKIKKEIEQIAAKSVEAMAKRIIRKPDEFDKYLHNQDLSGVDIIINKDLKPYVIELNPANSCGVYQLMKFDGIESVFPIANSILSKALLVKIILESK